MSNGGADIIIKGSSVDIEYDDAKFPKDPAKPHNHKSSDYAITRVTVEDGNSNMKYDTNSTGADPSLWTIHVYCAAPTKPANKS